MNDKDRSYITLLFARVVAFLFAFIIVSMVVGVILARLKGIQINSDRVWGVLEQLLMMMAGSVLTFLAIGGRDKPNPEDKNLDTRKDTP